MIHVNEEGSYLPVDIAISGERNMIKKEAKKKLQNSCNTIYLGNRVCFRCINCKYFAFR
jgi:hypothetical protein